MRRLLPLFLLVAAFGLTAACGDSTPRSEEPLLHVSSPDWRDQVVYFVMTDRFDDGDPANDDQGLGEFDPSDNARYSGGDLKGVVDRLDYIEGLGATAVWITPPVAAQWWDPLVEYGGYHGYWARNFEQVDEHLGTLEDYKTLSDALHRRQMYLVQDIVANHVGNFFDYDPAAWDPSDPTAGLIVNDGSVPTADPTQAPFDLNDPRKAEDRAASIYHWTPAIADYQVPEQVLEWQLSNLDDLNTSNPQVRKALKDSYGYWIREVGVDAFRIDTVVYVEHDFWRDFMHADDGILAAAQATGRDDFLAFGEAWVTPEPLDDTADRTVASYVGTPEAPELGAVLNFPLYFTTRRVFAEGAPTSHLGYRVRKAMEIHADPYRMPMFVDNHDVERFLSRADEAAFRQALLFMMTMPGIPVIFQGTEQGFTETRASMFAGGFGSGGVDHFDTGSGMYGFVSDIVAMRKAHPVFTRGTVEVLRETAAGPGPFALARAYEGDTSLALFNTAEHTVLVDNLETGLPEGRRLDPIAQVGLPDGPDEVVVGPGGRLTLTLPPRSALVLEDSQETAPVPTPETTVTITSDLSGLFTGDVPVAGTVDPVGRVRLVVDGDLENAGRVPVAQDGTWSGTIPLWRFGPGEQVHEVVAYAEADGAVSGRVSFRTDIQATLPTVSVADPAGDDTGPDGTYTLPDNDSFNDQMDILGLSATGYGATLEVSVEMAELTTSWNPRNGFDHVAFHVFVDLPGQEGTTVLPELNAAAPDGFAWDRMAFAEGWNLSAHSAVGADADHRGAGVPAPSVAVDGTTVTFTFSPSSLGNVTDLTGTRVYVTTWDYDGVEGVLRPLTPDGGVWAFGGGDGAVDPLILDDTAVLTLQ